jgi:arylsulfatase A-like enzyme
MVRSLSLLLALCLCGSASAVRAAEKSPNVVLVVIDDLGQRDLGCYGSSFYRTPHLDRMARDGLRFTDFYAACPVCSPTRASILTGRYPPRMTLTDWIPGRPDAPDQRLKRPDTRTALPADEVTVARVLQKNGYATALIGKWHLGGKGSEPTRFGFDLNVAGDETGTARSYFAPFADKTGTMPGLERAGDGEYLTDRLTTEAERFIEKNKDRPFFLYLPHYAVHTPLKAPQAVIDRYKVTPAHGRQSNPTYAAMVELMDASVGRVLKKLDDLKLSDNTLVLFTSDNGGLATLEGVPFAPTCNAPLREGKGYLYEGGIRVPLVVKWPGKVKAGTTTDQVGCSIDFFDTILDATGTKCDSKRDGVSLMPVLKGEKVPERPIFWHYPHYANQGGRPGGAIRYRGYKLIEYYEDGRLELFDLKTDISESRNLSDSDARTRAALGGMLKDWRKDVGAKMPTPNPDYKPNPPDKSGAIALPARTALVSGVMLRFEPLPHKNTLGYWVNKDDYATFDFTADKPGTFNVEVLQGCGTGSGGAEVELAVGDEKLTFKVKETGGFQNFEAREVGTLKIERAGRHRLTVKAKTKPGGAVMELRQIVLTPVK